MEKINAVVGGQLMSVPVLTPKHLAAMQKIQSGAGAACDPGILHDLLQLGMLEVSNGK